MTRPPYTWLPETGYDLGELLAELAIVEGVSDVKFKLNGNNPRRIGISLVSHVAGTHENAVLTGMLRDNIVSRLEFVAACPLGLVRRVADRIDVLR